MEFQALTPRIDREIDPAKRLPLVHQAEAIMEQDPPLLPVAWERINEIWYNYVKGLNPAAYRHLRRRALGYGLARQGVNHTAFRGCTCGLGDVLPDTSDGEPSTPRRRMAAQIVCITGRANWELPLSTPRRPFAAVGCVAPVTEFLRR